MFPRHVQKFNLTLQPQLKNKNRKNKLTNDDVEFGVDVDNSTIVVDDRESRNFSWYKRIQHLYQRRV